MGLKLAKHAAGYCVGCGLLIEAGEYYLPDRSGLRHPRCYAKSTNSNQRSSYPVPFGEEDTKPAFDGDTFHDVYDGARLGAQMGRVIDLVSEGEWRTLSQRANATECLERSAGARL